MKKFQAKPSLISIIFYLLLLGLWLVVVVTAGKDYWYAGLAPWYGMGLILLISGTRYRIEHGSLIVRNPFERRQIPLERIEKVEEVRNPLWKRALTGFPAFSLRVTHDEGQALLHAHQADVLREMMASVYPST